MLRKYPVILARMARRHVQAALAAARDGYGTARLGLRDAIPVHAIDGVLRMYEYEGSHAAATERAVGLVERAPAGERWNARSRTPDPTDQPEPQRIGQFLNRVLVVVPGGDGGRGPGAVVDESAAAGGGKVRQDSGRVPARLGT
ncbi:hypothetical protein [Embleya sp. NPDC020630]|uniref:hypothetical protein n=1 Tax=Embleya sp. NPDC020630 TaxID=3363979 RepID=UPI0037A977B9